MKNLLDRISNFLESRLFPVKNEEAEPYYEWLKKQTCSFENVQPEEFNAYWENLINHKNNG